MRRIAFFEGPTPADLQPVAHLRPVFELRCGHFSVRERVLRALPTAEWGVCVRPWLAEVYSEEHPESRINDEAWLRAGPTLFVDGRWLGDPRTLADLDPGCVGILDDECVWMMVDPDEAVILDPTHPAEGLARIARNRKPVPAGGQLAKHPWDLVHHNGQQLELDFHLRGGAWARPAIDPQLALQGPPEHIHVAPEATIDPFVVLDARGGPIWIEAGAKLLPFTRVEGPCYIGRETQVFRAHVREGTSIGPVCRVGGEIEESILHGYANKYHDGFLGHSYVCPWVNLGALTSNSDLKNDYSNVSVPLAGVSIPSGSTKVGCFIGDHTKTALSTLFNTGSAIGVMTMLLPGGELLPKHVPSFSRLWHGRLESLPEGIEPSLAIARAAMGRRNRELTPAAERLLREVFRQTAGERQLALQRADSVAHSRGAVPSASR
jgi:UDP-N-acetylglucosamine diphosphorylase/glucosamine-1-phosphate N-acetyltransferase